MRDTINIDRAVETVQSVITVARLALMVSRDDLREATRQAEHEATIVYALDPTLALKSGESFEDTVKLLHAFAEFRAAVVALDRTQRT